ncbi:sodium:proton antiporter [Thiocapsa imhoffii]|uniref:Sodium:proton antiporter n=1 Tax=Thiocapsa imhoffii TaxID=382777 RepID=A0A9X1BAY0_9GAMM|nr:Na+/H+ antiporter subunit E [Thiocapsa imhoffii]MBK1646296.1 sodium:proton antiporter [Thiocapsa imhoffii]
MRQRLQWGAVLFVVWLGLTLSLHPQELIAGLLICGAIVWLAVPAAQGHRPWNLWGLIRYLPVFLKNLILANMDVARRVLDPTLPINPGIIRIQTDLREPHQRLLLANSITLTPGTVTLDLDGDDLYVHWIDVASRDPVRAGEVIKGELERAIKRI